MRRFLRAGFVGGFIFFGVVIVALRVQNGALFLKRLATYPHWSPNFSVDWYQDRAVVEGTRELPEFPEGKPLAPETIERIERYLFDTRSRAFLVLQDGARVAEWYAPGTEPSVISNSMSMMKSVMALLAGVLVTENVIPGLDLAVGAQLVEWRGDPRGKITLRQLLQNTSGLRVWDAMYNPFSDLVRMHLGADADAIALGLPLVHPPGTVSRYNNANFQLVGLFFERLTGMPLAELLSERLWKPVGLSTAQVVLDRPGGRARTYCCLLATPRDWALLGQWVLERGRTRAGKTLIRASYLEGLVEPSPLRPAYATGFWTDQGPPDEWMVRHRKAPFEAEPVIMMDGQGWQKVYVVPKYRLVVVRNGEYSPSWDDSFLVNEVVRSVSGHAL